MNISAVSSTSRILPTEKTKIANKSNHNFGDWLWKGLEPISKTWKTFRYNPSSSYVKSMLEANNQTDKLNVAIRALSALPEEKITSQLSTLIFNTIKKLSATDFESICKRLTFEIIHKRSPNLLKNFLKHVEVRQLQQLIPQSINDELKRLALNTIPPTHASLKRKDWQKLTAMFQTFIPNLINTILLQFNYWSDGRLPETDWAMNCFFEIHYKLFMIPIALFIVANTILSSPLVALGVTVAIITAIITSLYIYIKYFQECPLALPHCRNLTLEASMGRLFPVVGREEEIQRVITYLGNLEKDQSLNPILVGNSGVGKTDIMNGIAQRIVRGDVPANLLNKKLFSINTASLVEGGFDGYAKKLDAIMLRLRGFQEEVILFFDEIHIAMQKDKKALATFLKTFAVPGGVHCAAATTDEGFNQIQKDPAFQRRFQPVEVEGADPALTKQILYQKVKNNEPTALFTPDTFDYIYEQTNARMPERANPSKSVDVLTQAINKVELVLEGNNHIPVNLRNKRNEVESLKSSFSASSFQLNAVNQDLVRNIEKAQAELDQLESEWKLKSSILKKARQLVNDYHRVKKELISDAHEIFKGNNSKELLKEGAFKLHLLLPQIEKSIMEFEEALGPDFKIRIDQALVNTVIDELLVLK